jgi:hypothetical protein
MTSEGLQRRHDEDAISLGDRVADELLRVGLADEVLHLPVSPAPVEPDAPAKPQQHTGMAYGCPVCAAAGVVPS